jgi:hypothetical protein
MPDHRPTPERTIWSGATDEASDEAHELACEVIRWMLVWIADAPTMIDRGLRATVALHCLRPDLIDTPTLEQIGDEAARTQQHVHALALTFRLLMGLPFSS